MLSAPFLEKVLICEIQMQGIRVVVLGDPILFKTVTYFILLLTVVNRGVPFPTVNAHSLEELW